MPQPAESLPRRRAPMRNQVVWFALFFLIAGAAAGNYLVPHALANSHDYFTTLFGACVGALVAQAAVLCIWCALGPQSILIQVPISIGTLICLTTLYFKALEEFQMPVSVIVAIAALIMLFCVCILTPCLAYRKFSNAAIRRITFAKAKAPNQFRLEDLLVMTAAFAVIIGVTQSLFPGDNQFYMPDRAIFVIEFWQTLTPLLTFAIFSAVLSLACLGAVFANRYRVYFAIALAVTLLFGPLVPSALAIKITGLPVSADWYFNLYAFAWSLGFFNLAILGFFFALNFRLIRD